MASQILDVFNSFESEEQLEHSSKDEKKVAVDPLKTEPNYKMLKIKESGSQRDNRIESKNPKEEISDRKDQDTMEAGNVIDSQLQNVSLSIESDKQLKLTAKEEENVVAKSFIDELNYNMAKPKESDSQKEGKNEFADTKEATGDRKIYPSENNEDGNMMASPLQNMFKLVSEEQLKNTTKEEKTVVAGFLIAELNYNMIKLKKSDSQKEKKIELEKTNEVSGDSSDGGMSVKRYLEVNFPNNKETDTHVLENHENTNNKEPFGGNGKGGKKEPNVDYTWLMSSSVNDITIPQLENKALQKVIGQVKQEDCNKILALFRNSVQDKDIQQPNELPSLLMDSAFQVLEKKRSEDVLLVDLLPTIIGNSNDGEDDQPSTSVVQPKKNDKD
ncbi:uncharacterized protein LOC127715104 [Mytilus californianus]|uniref:uncharacterized protein LOC127715104 n=1 Tax=Mytilus californianus TaxID=6549 RepID=UPI002246F3CC|nr:uncharacterized protein LOC127715104 [Mytilus californianus]